MTLAWSPPKMQRPIPIDGYIVEPNKLTGFTWVRCHESHVPVPEFTVSNLSEEADDQFRVSAVNAHGQSPSLEFPGSVHLGKHKNPNGNGSVWAEQLCWFPKDVSFDFKDSSALTHQRLSFITSSPVNLQLPLKWYKFCFCDRDMNILIFWYLTCARGRTFCNRSEA